MAAKLAVKDRLAPARYQAEARSSRISAIRQAPSNLIGVDTRHAEVVAAALQAGVTWSVRVFCDDCLLEVTAAAEHCCCIWGDPQTMQCSHGSVIGEVALISARRLNGRAASNAKPLWLTKDWLWQVANPQRAFIGTGGAAALAGHSPSPCCCRRAGRAATATMFYMLYAGRGSVLGVHDVQQRGR